MEKIARGDPRARPARKIAKLREPRMKIPLAPPARPAARLAVIRSPARRGIIGR
jgi:hypothetical protein